MIYLFFCYINWYKIFYLKIWNLYELDIFVKFHYIYLIYSFILLYFLFSFYWLIYVLKNFIHYYCVSTIVIFSLKQSKNQKYFHLKMYLHAKARWNSKFFCQFYGILNNESYTVYRINTETFLYQVKDSLSSEMRL